MSKMSELDSELRELLSPDQLFPPQREEYDAALGLLLAARKSKASKVLPEQVSML